MEAFREVSLHSEKSHAMPVIALLVGLVLVIQGLFAYLTAEPDPVKGVSVTALIPAFFGGPIFLSGLVAMKSGMRKHAMHAAVMVGLLGALAGWGRGIGVIVSKGFDPANWALMNVLFMAVICTFFVVMCVRSFIAARKRQAAAKASQ